MNACLPIDESIFMQQQVYQSCHPLLTTRNFSTRERLRQFGRGVSNSLSFRKSPKIGSEAVPSSSIEQPGQDSGFSTDSSQPKAMPSTPGSSVDSFSPPTMDGPNERLFARSQRTSNPTNVSAIFVHAGAGYHSTTNEHIHLGACNE